MSNIGIFRVCLITLKNSQKTMFQKIDYKDNFFKKMGENLNKSGQSHHNEPSSPPEFQFATQQSLYPLSFGTLLAEEDEDLVSDECLGEKNGMEKNMIKDRIQTVQYEANSPCEDTICSAQLQSIDAYTVSIFDGHGGRDLAEFSKQKINEFIDSFIKQNIQKPQYSKPQTFHKLFQDSIEFAYQSIESQYLAVYMQQLQIGNKKIKNVGTCALTAIIHNNKVYVGNSGDSQAIFILQNDSKHEYLKANARLSANNKNERERIQKKFANIEKNVISQENPNVFYLKGRLQPTKTIGDYYLKRAEHYNGNDTFNGPYLDCIPDVSTHEISSKHRYLVMASDGVWDCLSKSEVIDILMNGKTINLNETVYSQVSDSKQPFVQELLHRIIEKSSEMSGLSVQEIKKMEKGKRRNYHDDITFAVVDLANQI